MVTLKAEPFKSVDDVVKKFLNQVIYAGWPHYTEAKVVQIFDATKHFDGSSGDVKESDDSRDFNNMVESLQIS